MTHKIKAIEVSSTDNIHTLKGIIYIPDGEIKGIFGLGLMLKSFCHNGSKKHSGKP